MTTTHILVFDDGRTVLIRLDQETGYYTWDGAPLDQLSRKDCKLYLDWATPIFEEVQRIFSSQRER